MSEKKVVSRNLAIVLGIICIILGAGVGAGVAGVMTTNQLAAKDSQIATLNDSISAKDSELQQLQVWFNGNVTLLNQYKTWLAGNITYYKSLVDFVGLQNLLDRIHVLEDLVTELQNQVSNKLIGVNLRVVDNRTDPLQPYLHVYGYVVNAATNQTANAKLYVTALDGTVMVFNATEISLGNIGGGGYVYVDKQIPYTGNPLTAWQVWSSPAGIVITRPA